MKPLTLIIAGIIIIAAFGVLFLLQGRQFRIPKGETVLPDGSAQNSVPSTSATPEAHEGITNNSPSNTMTSHRTIATTDGVKHSIPLNEILSGGPGKDGIPSIDNPKIIPAKEATFLADSDIGIGLTVGTESRFYPYRILVWHEIANDTIQGKPVLVTYCPLCATGIVFDRSVNGVVQEFGVSGMLWQSNLLMYNRAGTEASESLWSQVLGEAVLGVDTGMRLSVVRSDVVRWGDWEKSHPDTTVLSRDTGAVRDYGRDPYGDYYTSQSVSFGATFTDTRLHPKTLVHGIEIGGAYKAYPDESLKSMTGTVTDTFAGKDIVITRTDAGEISVTAGGEPIDSISGFWFSWLAVHPDTELFTN